MGDYGLSQKCQRVSYFVVEWQIVRGSCTVTNSEDVRVLQEAEEVLRYHHSKSKALPVVALRSMTRPKSGTAAATTMDVDRISVNKSSGSICRPVSRRQELLPVGC